MRRRKKKGGKRICNVIKDSANKAAQGQPQEVKKVIREARDEQLRKHGCQ